MIYTNKNQLTNQPTHQSCAQLLDKPDKQLLGEAEDNRKRLRKGPESQTNKVANNHRPRSSDSSEHGQIATKQAIHLKTVGSRQTLPRNN